MGALPKRIYGAIAEKQAIAGFFSEGEATLPFVTREEIPQFDYIPVQRTIGGASPWRLFDATGWDWKAAIGRLDDPPDAGFFRLTCDGDTTDLLAITATAAQVQTALNALESVTYLGGVTVTGNAISGFRVAWNTTGTKEPFTGDATNTVPASIIVADTEVIADGTHRGIDLIRLVQAPAALDASPIALPSGTVVVDVLEAGGSGVSAVQRISFSEQPLGGSFTLAFDSVVSAPIGINDTAETVQAKLEAVDGIGAGNVVVTGGAGEPWIVNFTGERAGESVSVFVAGFAGVVFPAGVRFTLDLRTSGARALVFGSPSVEVTFEVQGKPMGGEWVKVIQQPINLRNALISSDSYRPVDLETYPDPVDIPVVRTLTGSIGGTGYLDGVLTAGGAMVPPKTLLASIGGEFHIYRLQASDAVSSGSEPAFDVVRPLDYDAINNPVAWVKQS